MATWTASVTQAAIVRMRFCAEHERVAVAQRWVQAWAGGLLGVFGVDQHWASERPRAPHRARLVVANHRSPIDIILMLQHFGGSVLGRHDLETWPIMGWAAREGGTTQVWHVLSGSKTKELYSTPEDSPGSSPFLFHTPFLAPGRAPGYKNVRGL